MDCWWWEAGELDREKMRWQLEEMKRKGVSGTWYYPRLFDGHPLQGEPAYWSDEWWEMFRFSLQEHERLGMVAWTTDWSGVSGPTRPSEVFPNKLRAQREREPWLWGRRLAMHRREATAPGPLAIQLGEQETLLWAAAFRNSRHGLDERSRRDLAAEGRTITWQAPEAGWTLTAVVSQPHDLDYLDRRVAERWIDLLLAPHEQRLAGFIGSTLQAYSTDELVVLGGNILFSEALLERFRAEKGFDPRPLLAALFVDLGPRTDQVRCQYYDLMVALLEENLFRPFADWLHARGMRYTEFCPNGKWLDMLGQTYHYGDFFRYMRHYDFPGNEEDANRTRTFQAKLASSIAHLYGKERAGLTAYWGTGWGHTPQDNLAWTNENYAYGLNLYNRHGVLYSTLGGWYEWVPPAVHFRQPYWESWRTFSDHIRRLSYLLSQGRHVADVAVLYPVTTIQANWFAGAEFGAAAADAANTAYTLARSVYEAGIDLDFIDHESLARARVEDGRLKVSGLEFRVLLLPPLTTVRTATLAKVQEFWEGGGTVIAFRALPGASAEQGRDDPAVLAILEQTFGIESTAAHHSACAHRCTEHRVFRHASAAGGMACFVPSEATEHYLTVAELIGSLIEQDVVASEPGVYHTHQRTAELDIYFLFNTRAERRALEFALRVDGQPELWDAFSGEVRPLHRFAPRPAAAAATGQGDSGGVAEYDLSAVREGWQSLARGRTRVRLTMEPHQGSLVVFNRGSGERPAVLEDNLAEVTGAAPAEEGAIEVHGWCDRAGRKRVRAGFAGRRFAGETRVAAPPAGIPLDGDWECRLQPTMDNRWGDFRYPATPELIGAEARRFKYLPEGDTPGTELGWSARECADAAWPEFTFSHGPFWWASAALTYGLAEGREPGAELLADALGGRLDPAHWSWHSYSELHGSADPEVHNTSAQGLLGVSENFLVFPAAGGSRDAVRFLCTHLHSARDQELTFNFGGRQPFPRTAWVNGAQVLAVDAAAATRPLRDAPDAAALAGCDYTQRMVDLERPEACELEQEAAVRVMVRAGWNRVVLRLTQPRGRKLATYAVFHQPDQPPAAERYVPLLKWFRHPPGIRYDIFSESVQRVGWYRFEAPPGTRSIRLPLKARRVSTWVDGSAVPVTGDTATLAAPRAGVSQVALRVEHEPGYYAGAAFENPVAFTCEEGVIALGDWRDHALESYSGAVVYRRQVHVPAASLGGKALLDLGRVRATAAVRVNGTLAGIRLAVPYTFDISGLLQPGENSIEVTVHNTLANHYSAGYPTNFVYDGQTASGLFGPVTLRFLRQVSLRLEPERRPDG